MKLTRRTSMFAVLTVILTALILGSFRLNSPDSLPRCLDSPRIAFKTAQSPEEVVAIWNQLGNTKSNLKKGFCADFAFIAAYTFLFLFLAKIAGRRSIGFSQAAGILAAASTIVIAVADFGENLLALTIIATLQHGLPEAGQVALMREFSLTKWAACSLALVLFWWAFVPSRRGSALYRLITLTIAVSFVLSGTLGFLGLGDNSKIELVIPFLVPALVLQVPLFWFFWEDVVSSHAALMSQPVETWGM